MARFLVTLENQPGVALNVLGLIKPGTIFSWPDGDPKTLPWLTMQPVDQEAYDLLVKVHGADKVSKKWGAFKPYTQPKPQVEVPKSPAELARNLGVVEAPVGAKHKAKRLSDQ